MRRLNAACLIFLLFSSSTLLGKTLQNRYQVSDRTVYSTDIFPDAYRFVLAQIPLQSRRTTLQGQEIVDQFANYQIDINNSTSGAVIFELSSHFELKELENWLISRYHEAYSGLDLIIRSLVIESSSNADLSGYQLDSVNFKPSNLQRDRGSFSASFIDYSSGQPQKKTVFFRYRIEASLTVLQASNTIYNNALISVSNTEIVTIPLKNLFQKPLSPSLLGERRSQIYIPKGRMVSLKHVETIPDIAKKSRVIAVYQEGGIRMEMEVIAEEDGTIGESITVSKDKERYTGRIIKPGVVEIQ